MQQAPVWLTAAERRTHSQITKMYELVNHLAPSYLYLLVSHPNQQQYNLRNTRNLPLIFGTNSIQMNCGKRIYQIVNRFETKYIQSTP